MRPWKLAEINYGIVKQQDYEVAVLPLGATEPHNLHLPYGTDIFRGRVIGDKICEAAWNHGAKVVLLPTIPYGTETNLMRFPLAMNLNPATLAVVIGDLVDSLSRHGIHKIVFLNSHGGNDLKPVLRELYGQTAARLFLCNWFTVCKDLYEGIFAAADDHAGEIETSLMLAYHPELVARNADGSLAADDGRAAAFAVRGGQSRLGFDHAALAPLDDQQRLRQSARGHGRQGLPLDGGAGRAACRVPGRAFGLAAGRAVSVLVQVLVFSVQHGNDLLY